MLTTVLRVAEEAHESNPWAPVIGIGLFLVLIILLFVLLAFGAGREHT